MGSFFVIFTNLLDLLVQQQSDTIMIAADDSSARTPSPLYGPNVRSIGIDLLNERVNELIFTKIEQAKLTPSLKMKEEWPRSRVLCELGALSKHAQQLCIELIFIECPAMESLKCELAKYQKARTEIENDDDFYGKLAPAEAEPTCTDLSDNYQMHVQRVATIAANLRIDQ